MHFASWLLPDGSIVEHPLNQLEYEALAVSGRPPNRTGNASAVWVSARSAARFNTLSGSPEPGDLVDEGTSVRLYVPELAKRPTSHIRIAKADLLGDTSAPTLPAGKIPRLSITLGVATVEIL